MARITTLARCAPLLLLVAATTALAQPAAAPAPAAPADKPAPAAAGDAGAAPATAPDSSAANAKSERAKGGMARAGAKAGEPKPANADPGPLAPLSWLEGCWRGEVNERAFREHWLPLRGNLMLGVSHTVRNGATQDFEYLRLESRADGIYYINQAAGQKAREASFRFVDRKVDTANERNDEIYTFAAVGSTEFPQTIVYRRATEGWLYVSVEGKANGTDKKVLYPMRRVGCESGEFIRK